ncbi:MAG: hypothetical protein OEY59_13440 [Deltaproteobacteria bacterium]|nr:hypothetical protein [Deltaproteobacteria bacterium]
MNSLLGLESKHTLKTRENCLLKGGHFIESYCLICDVNTTNRKGEQIGYDKLKSKCSNKKSVLSKTLEDADNTEKKTKKK